MTQRFEKTARTGDDRPGQDAQPHAQDGQRHLVHGGRPDRRTAHDRLVRAAGQGRGRLPGGRVLRGGVPARHPPCALPPGRQLRRRAVALRRRQAHPRLPAAHRSRAQAGLPDLHPVAAFRSLGPDRPPAPRPQDPRRQVRVGPHPGRTAGARFSSLPGHDQAGDRGPGRSVGRGGRAGLQGRLRCLRDQPRHLSPGQHLPLAHLEQARGRIRASELREPHPLPERHRDRGQAALRPHLRRARAHERGGVQPSAGDHSR